MSESRSLRRLLQLVLSAMAKIKLLLQPQLTADENLYIVDDDTTAEIVRKMISHNHINGEIDGKYHFLLRD